MADKQRGVEIVATNRKARFRYSIEDTYEAGLELKGAEVKSLRAGLCSLEEAFARPFEGEVYLIGMHIPPYPQATVDIPDPDRRRKLLLHRSEIGRMIARCDQRGYTLVPLKIYFKGGWAKVQIGLARAKEHGDKRRKKQDEQRRKDIATELLRRSRRG